MLKIGNVKLENNLVLAPMLGVNCNAFRLLCKDYGASLVSTAMIHPDSLFYQENKIDVISEEKPIIAQIVGKDKEEMVKAALKLEKHADIIDINMGCPDKEILSKQCGAFFSKHPEQAYKMVEKVVNSVSCPVTAKIRIGWDEKSINALEVSKELENRGVSTITVHGRTRKQVYSGKANWNVIREVKENLDIPVIGNGDVFSASDYKNMMEKTGVDFVMVGRGAIGNPMIFRNCLDFVKGKEVIDKDAGIVRDLFSKFLGYYEKYSPRDSFSEIRQHAMWFCKGINGSARLKNNIMKCNDVDGIKKILRV